MDNGHQWTHLDSFGALWALGTHTVAAFAPVDSHQVQLQGNGPPSSSKGNKASKGNMPVLASLVVDLPPELDVKTFLSAPVMPQKALSKAPGISWVPKSALASVIQLIGFMVIQQAS